MKVYSPSDTILSFHEENSSTKGNGISYWNLLLNDFHIGHNELEEHIMWKWAFHVNTKIYEKQLHL
jgi:hypothetical protein